MQSIKRSLAARPNPDGDHSHTRDAAAARYGFRYFALVLPLLLICVSCNRSKVQAASGANLPAPLVSVVQASSQDVPRYLDEIGRNTAFESVNLMPQVAGRVAERRFQDGDSLKKGQLLFVIDPSPFQAQLDAA